MNILLVTLGVVSSAYAADSAESMRGYSRPSGIQWAIQKAFGFSFHGLNLGRTSGLRKNRIDMRQSTGVRTKNINVVMRESSGIKSTSRLLGPRKNLFRGKHYISGFKKTKRYR